ncbi:MAG: 50S ribosomal protein L25 [Acidimicrobiia bacterium]|nr:50S ribosomal protein L25 [Acidimicrobiia bacterium]
MADQVTLSASTGRSTGSRESRRIRRGGEVPAVVYGRDLDPIAVTVNHHDLVAALTTEAGRNVLINLEIGKESLLTMARQIERHPYRNQIRHIDFVTLSLKEKTTVSVAIHLEGDAIGVREGGVLAGAMATVEIEALPTDIPSFVVLDVSAMNVGDVLRVEDLPVIPGVEYLDDPDDAVVSVALPAAEPEPEEVEELLEGEEGEEGEGEAEGDAEGGEESEATEVD